MPNVLHSYSRHTNAMAFCCHHGCDSFLWTWPYVICGKNHQQHKKLLLPTNRSHQGHAEQVHCRSVLWDIIRDRELGETRGTGDRTAPWQELAGGPNRQPKGSCKTVLKWSIFNSPGIIRLRALSETSAAVLWRRPVGYHIQLSLSGRHGACWTEASHKLPLCYFPGNNVMMSCVQICPSRWLFTLDYHLGHRFSIRSHALWQICGFSLMLVSWNWKHWMYVNNVCCIDL